jgi:hypothetical protein
MTGFFASEYGVETYGFNTLTKLHLKLDYGATSANLD